MENKEERKVTAEEIKKETVDTVNQVKDSMKNVDLKTDAKEATGFVTSMLKDPFATMKAIVNDESNKHLKTAVLFLIIWTIACFVKAISIKYWRWSMFLHVIKATIVPVVSILVLAGIVYTMNQQEKKKSLSTVITAIITAQIPLIIASVISLLTIVSARASILTVPFTSLCSIISIILTYFTTKMLFNEEQNSKFIKKFIMIQLIYYVIAIVISFLEIYI